MRTAILLSLFGTFILCAEGQFFNPGGIGNQQVNGGNQPPVFQNGNQPPFRQNGNKPPTIQNGGQPPNAQNVGWSPNLQNVGQPPAMQNRFLGGGLPPFLQNTGGSSFAQAGAFSGNQGPPQLGGFRIFPQGGGGGFRAPPSQGGGGSAALASAAASASAGNGVQPLPPPPPVIKNPDDSIPPVLCSPPKCPPGCKLQTVFDGPCPGCECPDDKGDDPIPPVQCSPPKCPPGCKLQTVFDGPCPGCECGPGPVKKKCNKKKGNNIPNIPLPPRNPPTQSGGGTTPTDSNKSEPSFLERLFRSYSNRLNSAPKSTDAPPPTTPKPDTTTESLADRLRAYFG